MTIKTFALACATSAALASMTLASAANAQSVTLDYWMWDSAQKPAYEKCAARFTEKNPDIAVKISQYGWGDYWPTLATAFVSDTAPDVFIHNVLRFPEFLENSQMVNLSPLVERDGLDLGLFRDGLTDLWTAPDGAVYGIPKDWDTVALTFSADAVKEAGLDPAALGDLTWNPEDGGTFGETVKRLTLDANGNNGLSPDFDKTNVARYGFVYNRLDASGQITWSPLAYMNGFRHLDEPWTGQYNYDDEALVETIEWWRGLAQDGYAIPYSELGQLGRNALMAAGKGAMTFDGSWMINFYATQVPFEIGFAPLPQGPQGKRMSMINAVADAIWVGSDHKDEAWKWVRFMASRECQDVIGGEAVVFPSIPASSDIAVEAHKANGVDVSAFTDVATAEQTFPYPVTYHGSQVEDAMMSAFDRIFLGTDDVKAALGEANERVRSLF